VEYVQAFGNDDRVSFFFADVRGIDRLTRVVNGKDFVVYAVAINIIPTTAHNPSEGIKTNLIGAWNLIDVCLVQGIKRMAVISTYMASRPAIPYGATKLVSCKLLIASICKIKIPSALKINNFKYTFFNHELQKKTFLL
jgi:FlaA1/EpsC-like NDP-sugar epimerase